MSLCAVPWACKKFHELTWSFMSLYEVPCSMQFHELACSFMSLYAVPFFVWAVLVGFKKFFFHFDLNIINYYFKNPVGAIIIAHHKLDDQIGAFSLPFPSYTVLVSYLQFIWSWTSSWLESPSPRVESFPTRLSSYPRSLTRPLSKLDPLPY